jgi:hypothetical protein
MFLIYAVPFNEGRGIYLHRSEDNGRSWGSPFRYLMGRSTVGKWFSSLRSPVPVMDAFMRFGSTAPSCRVIRATVWHMPIQQIMEIPGASPIRYREKGYAGPVSLVMERPAAACLAERERRYTADECPGIDRQRRLLAAADLDIGYCRCNGQSKPCGRFVWQNSSFANDARSNLGEAFSCTGSGMKIHGCQESICRLTWKARSASMRWRAVFPPISS